MYEFTEDMREISGFGGSYEACCRKMLRAGLKYLDNHDLDPKYEKIKNVVGITRELNDDAEELRDVIVDACGASPTGAMYGAVLDHILWIRRHSWEEFVERLTDRNTKHTKNTRLT